MEIEMGGSEDWKDAYENVRMIPKHSICISHKNNVIEFEYFAVYISFHFTSISIRSTNIIFILSSDYFNSHM